MAGTGNLFECTFSGALNGQFVQNVLHMQVELEDTPDDWFLVAYALALGVGSDLGGLYLDCLPETYVFSSIRCRAITPAASATATFLISSSSNHGTRAAEFSTYVEGPLLTFPVVLSRPVLGKIFIPGVAEEDIEYGILSDSLKFALSTLNVGLISGGSFTGDDPGTYKYCVANGAKTDWKVPSAGVISPTIGTQRRRARPLF